LVKTAASRISKISCFDVGQHRPGGVAGAVFSRMVKDIR
jgi:hypothetical protein